MKKQTYGIDELKQLIDTAALATKVFSGKMNLWQRILLKFGGMTKLVKQLKEIWDDRNKIQLEIMDLDAHEAILLNTYACDKLGINKRFVEAINEIITGIEQILTGIGKLKK